MNNNIELEQTHVKLENGIATLNPKYVSISVKDGKGIVIYRGNACEICGITGRIISQAGDFQFIQDCSCDFRIIARAGSEKGLLSFDVMERYLSNTTEKAITKVAIVVDFVVKKEPLRTVSIALSYNEVRRNYVAFEFFPEEDLQGLLRDLVQPELKEVAIYED